MTRSKVLALLATGMVAALMVLFPAAASAGEQLRTVVQENQFLYSDPEFAGPPLSPVPRGANVTILLQAGDWYRVTYKDRTGWLHRQAFGLKVKLDADRTPLTGLPVKGASRDEVALAGKAEKMPSPSALISRVGELATIKQDQQALYAAPQAGSEVLARLPAATQVKVVAEADDWLKIDYQGKTGWLPARAVKAD
jgi:uncharacterized protein YgiM (DUF1202 family)